MLYLDAFFDQSCGSCNRTLNCPDDSILCESCENIANGPYGSEGYVPIIPTQELSFSEKIP